MGARDNTKEMNGAKLGMSGQFRRVNGRSISTLQARMLRCFLSARVFLRLT